MLLSSSLGAEAKLLRTPARRNEARTYRIKKEFARTSLLTTVNDIRIGKMN